MTTKRALDVTTKGWSNDEIASLTKKINELNFRWEVKAVNQSGTIKWFHSYTKVDAEILALQEGYRILEMVKKIEVH